MTTARITSPEPEHRTAGRHYRWRRYVLHAFLISMAVVWIFPMAYGVITSLRSYDETAVNGYASVPALSDLSLDNFVQAWNQAELLHFFWNTAIIVVPAVILVLFLGSMMAFTVSRYSWKFNLSLLMLFTALNLLPPQIVITPLWWMYVNLFKVPEDILPGIISGFPSDNGLLYDQVIGMIMIHVAFQLGCVTFVLSNYMKTIPKELSEAAAVDGASVPRQFFQVILPLTRPALAALGTLEFTWLYNDFFWGAVLLNQGSERPITSSIAVLNGQYAQEYNLIAAASIMIALPTLIVYLVLQKHFVGGLTLGANKG